MKNVLNVVCICFVVMCHPDKYSNGIPADSLNVTVLGNDSSTFTVYKKRKLLGTSVDKKPINYPNPFSSSTTILYKISSPGYVTITIFDLLGREVCWYNEGFKNIGESKIKINLEFLNSGVYFYEIKVGGMRLAFNRLTLLK